jgi:hypothetical protein
MDLSQLAAAGTRLDLAIAEARGEVKVTRLAPAKPRRSQLVYTAGTRSTGYRAAGVKVRGGSGCNAAVPTSQWHN